MQAILSTNTQSFQYLYSCRQNVQPVVLHRSLAPCDLRYGEPLKSNTALPQALFTEKDFSQVPFI